MQRRPFVSKIRNFQFRWSLVTLFHCMMLEWISKVREQPPARHINYFCTSLTVWERFSFSFCLCICITVHMMTSSVSLWKSFFLSLVSCYNMAWSLSPIASNLDSRLDRDGYEWEGEGDLFEPCHWKEECHMSCYGSERKIGR